MTDDGVLLKIHGETLRLLPERAVVWMETRTLVVADTHFGKSSIFRHHGVAVPSGSDEYDRQRLTGLVRRERAQRLLILGDFLHAPLHADGADAREIAAWCEALRGTLCGTEIHVIAGNHDRGAWKNWQPPVTWHEGDRVEPPFRFTHDADRAAPGLFTLSGHIHPVVRISGLRKRAPRIPVFWQRDAGLVLPSFGIFTGGYLVAPGPRDRIYAAGPERVVQFR